MQGVNGVHQSNTFVVINCSSDKLNKGLKETLKAVCNFAASMFSYRNLKAATIIVSANIFAIASAAPVSSPCRYDFGMCRGSNVPLKNILDTILLIKALEKAGDPSNLPAGAHRIG